MTRVDGMRTTLHVVTTPDAMEHERLTHAIIGAAMRVHNTLAPGYLEIVYRNALGWELRLAGHQVETERRLLVTYRDLTVGAFVADLIVDDLVLLELKAARALNPRHAAQTVNYLTTTGIDVGLLLNFGAARLEMRRVRRIYVSSRHDRNHGRDDGITG